MQRKISITLPSMCPQASDFIQRLEPIRMTITNAVQNGNNPYAFIPNGKEVADIMSLVHEKKKFNVRMLIVIGIGGSNLGTMALQQAMPKACDPEIEIAYADTVDSDSIASMLNRATTLLTSGSEILVNLISKSGRTTESIANFELFLALLQKHRPDTYGSYIVVTTDHGSPLEDLARSMGWCTLTIPKVVGGRYSVFTAAGLFPLAIIGIDVRALLEGARAMLAASLEPANEAQHAAAWLFMLAQKGYTIANLFLFSNDLAACGAWWRQLIGESLGKACTQTGEKNGHPLVPIVSIGTTDLHSVGQLYLANILPIATLFVLVDHSDAAYVLPDYPIFEPVIPHIQKRSLDGIMHAIAMGVQRAYKAKELPFYTINLPEKNAFYLGQFMAHHIFTTIYLAQLLGVNAFDQPEVESYKKEVRDILASR